MPIWIYNTRKLLYLTEDSLIFEDVWLSHEARNNRSVNMISGRLTSADKQCQQCGFSQSVKKSD